MLKIEDFENYIIQPNNVSDACIQKHIRDNERCNTFVGVDEWITFLQTEQRESLQKWLNYLNNIDCSEDVKKWILSGILKSAYFMGDHFGMRTKRTINPFPELNKWCVEEAIPYKSDNRTFKKVYADAIKSLLEKKSNIGVWKKFSGISNVPPLMESLEGWFTRWCIKSYSYAYLHLLAGNVYVYFTEVFDRNVFPRVSVGVERSGTVRCVGLEDQQMIEESMQPILEDFLLRMGIKNDKGYRLRYGFLKK